MRCPVVDNSRSSPVLTQGLPCGVFCDKLEKNLQGSDRMSLREKLLRVAPEEWENEFVRIRPMTTRDDLIYAGDGCRLTDEQREFVNPVWFSLGRAYLAPEDHDPCLIENERREPIGFLCFTAWADAYSWSYFLDVRQQGLRKAGGAAGAPPAPAGRSGYAGQAGRGGCQHTGAAALPLAGLPAAAGAGRRRSHILHGGES